MKNVLKPWNLIPALLALLLALAGCFNDGVNGGGTETEGLSGTVVDPGGNAVANARVLVLPDTGSALAKRFAAQAAIFDSARTDSKGRYRIDSLPEGTYALLAGTVRNDTVLTVLVRGIVHDGGERDLGVLVLKVGGSISVTIRSGGQTVADARCSVEGLSGVTTISTINGTCTLSGLPLGTYRVTVTHPTLGSGQTQEIEVKAGQTANGGRVDLVTGGPGPIDTTDPGPIDTTDPGPIDTTDPGPIDTTDPGPIDTTGPSSMTLLTGADTYVNRSSNGSGVHLVNNFGGGAGLLVGVYDLSTIPTGLFRFTMPSGVSGARITKAVLRIHSYGWTEKNVHPATITVKLHSVLRDWKEGNGNGVPNSSTVDGVTALERFWGTQNGAEDWSAASIGFNGVDASAAEVTAVTKPNLYNGGWEFDVTALAKAWANTPAQNFGVLLRVDVPASNALVEDYPAFYSRESAVDDSLKPSLILNIAP